MLFLLVITSLILIPLCYTCYSSPLLGAFLSGFIFCENEVTMKIWKVQIKRILNLLVKCFFAATIGFEIPIMTIFNLNVLQNGFLFFMCIIGKLITGIFAKPFTLREVLKISLSMSVWGEFAFVLATTCKANKILTHEEFSSIIFAILLSIIISPIILKFVFNNSKSQIQPNNSNSHSNQELSVKEVEQTVIILGSP